MGKGTVMRCYLLLLFCFILCSCGHSYTNNEAIDAVNASVDALEQSLPKECKTQAINSQFTAIRKETAAIEKDCSAAIDKANSAKIKWKTAFFGLLLAIGVFIARKVII